MAEIIVPAVISVLLSPQMEKLVSKALAALAKSKDSKECRDLNVELKYLDLKLNIIRSFMEDAESKQFKNKKVKDWLSELKDVAYDAEDLLDEYVTDIALLQMRKDSRPKKGFLKKIFKSRPSSSQDSAISVKINYRSVLDKIKDINNRFEHLDKMKDGLGLQKLESPMQSFQNISRWRESSSVLDPHIFGRDDIKEQIVKMLTSDDAESSRTELPVLPIVGMGGVGKTTLAQLVFHDDHVKKNFDFKIWVWVSQDFDHWEILRRIISDIEEKPCSLESMQDLHKKVQKTIENKKILLVLDDAWNEDSQLWDQVLQPLRSGKKGSVLVVTTRSHSVANSIHGHMKPIKLEALDDELIWKVVENFAFGGPADPNKYMEHIDIGKQMVKKLNGSPLAAKAIGRLLNNDLRIEHWRRTLSSEMWELDGESKHGILPSLMLSYQNLSPDLRQCFRLCSLFPKGYKFALKGEHLISVLAYIWMAQDILQVKKDKTPEDCALDAINDLLSTSLFQEDRYGEVTMHDLIHDVSKHVAQDDHLHVTNGVLPKKRPDKVRHISLYYTSSSLNQNLDVDLLDVPCKYEKLRTLLTIDRGHLTASHDNVIRELLERSTCLRVLDLSQCFSGQEFPESICKQKHLRYLDISSTGISKLPGSLKYLYNLQTLCVYDCKNLKEVPDTIGSLIHLLYLELSRTPISELPESLTSLKNLEVLGADCEKLSRLPNGMTNLVNLRRLDARPESIRTITGIGRMTSLEVLEEFQVNKVNDWGIEELKRLNMLQGSLSISCLENVASEDEARKADLDQKVFLKRLTLEWSEDITFEGKVAEEVLEALKPSGDRLEYLTIKGYKGRVFPSWLFQTSHPCMLTSLKSLYIYGCAIKDESLKMCLRYFNSLQELSVKNCPNLWEPLEKEVVIACMERSLRNLEVGGGNWGFYFTLEKKDDSTWKLKIEDLVYSLQGTTSTRRWAWELLLGITSRDVKELRIYNCNVESTHGDFKELFLVTDLLNELTFNGCKQLLSLPTYLRELTTVRELLLEDCPEIQSLEDVGQSSSLCGMDRNDESAIIDVGEASEVKGLPCLSCPKMQSIPNISLPASLKRLSISFCPSLASLPSDMRGLTSLEVLDLNDCPNLASLPYDMRGVTSLKVLVLSYCPKIQSMSDVRLPASLKGLFILHCENLRSLPSDMGGMPSLQRLWLLDCPTITSFPDTGLPASLLDMWLEDCPNIRSFPDTGLPASLRDLSIIKCPALEGRYRRETGGPDWDVLSRVPNIRWSGFDEWTSKK